MSEQALFNYLLLGSLASAAAVFILLFFLVAPYGRHARAGWGPAVSNRLGWLLMEAAAPLVFVACFFLRDNPASLTTIVFLIMWEAHYIHRAFIYPFGLRNQSKRMPLLIIGLAFLYNVVNGYLNGRYIFTFSGGYPIEWLGDIRFVIGFGLFVAGFVINRQSDRVLRNLRSPGESGYRIPLGRLYRWISCPNYLGEITTWVGWAIATWSLPGLAFALWTIANLAPRARAHHTWYHQEFDDYPRKRKALVPGIW